MKPPTLERLSVWFLTGLILLFLYLLIQCILKGLFTLDLFLVAAAAFLLRFFDVSFLGHLISPSGGVILAAFFIFGPLPGLLAMVFSLFGLFLFRKTLQFNPPDLTDALVQTVGASGAAVLFHQYVIVPRLGPVVLSTYSLALFLGLAGTIAVYYLTAALLTIAIRTSSGGNLRRLVGTLVHPLYLAIFCVLGLSTILLVPVYFQLGVPGLLLGLLPLCVFFYAVRLYLRMRDVYRQALRALVGSIEAMDPYTHGHSDRVAGFCIEIGRRLGFSENHLRLLEYAAYLHDMGKVTIDPAILHKKGSLNEVEWAVIRSHPSEGAEILKPVGFLHKILPWIAHHHEKADGTGYPEALPLERTPLEARIISAADAFDAMVSDRPYRAALSIEETVLEMQRNQNTQFDARIVGIISQLVASADFVRRWRERLPL